MPFIPTDQTPAPSTLLLPQHPIHPEPLSHCFSCPLSLVSLSSSHSFPHPPAPYQLLHAFPSQLFSASLLSVPHPISLTSCPSTCMFISPRLSVRLAPRFQQEEPWTIKETPAFHSTAEHCTGPLPPRGTPCKNPFSALSVPADNSHVSRGIFWKAYPVCQILCLQSLVLVDTSAPPQDSWRIFLNTDKTTSLHFPKFYL